MPKSSIACKFEPQSIPLVQARVCIHGWVSLTCIKNLHHNKRRSFLPLPTHHIISHEINAAYPINTPTPTIISPITDKNSAAIFSTITRPRRARRASSSSPSRLALIILTALEMSPTRPRAESRAPGSISQSIIFLLKVTLYPPSARMCARQPLAVPPIGGYWSRKFRRKK